MNRLFVAGIFVLACVNARAQELIPYGVAKEISFCLYDYTTPNEKEVTVTFEAADVKVSQSGSEANSTNAPTDNGDCFDLTLTATETDTNWVHVAIDDDDNVWLPIDFRFATYGHPDSANPWIGIPGPAFGTAQATDSDPTSIQLPTSYAYSDDAINNSIVCVVAGASAPNCRLITDYVGSTDEATVSAAFQTDPTTTTKFYVLNAHQGFIETDPATGYVSADVRKLSQDQTAADNAEAVFDNTGFPLSNSTISLTSTQVDTITNDAGARIIELNGANPDISQDCLLALVLSYSFGEWQRSGNAVTYQNPAGANTRATLTLDTSNLFRDAVTLSCP